MDIQISSNFERYLFELNGSDSEKLHKMMEEFSSSGKLRVDKTVLEKAQNDFCSASVENTETLETIREIWNRENYLVDPHTAVGIREPKKINSKLPTSVSPVPILPSLEKQSKTRWGNHRNFLKN